MNILAKKGFRWFFVGFGTGTLSALAVILSAAVIDLYLHPDDLWDGQCDDYCVQINKQPDRAFERTFDVFIEDQALARFGHSPFFQ